MLRSLLILAALAAILTPSFAQQSECSDCDQDRCCNGECCNDQERCWLPTGTDIALSPAQCVPLSCVSLRMLPAACRAGHNDCSGSGECCDGVCCLPEESCVEEVIEASKRFLQGPGRVGPSPRICRRL